MKFQVKRTCRFRCALCVAQPDGKVLNEVDGICDGMLLHEPLGENGFGYDPIFYLPEYGCTSSRNFHGRKKQRSATGGKALRAIKDELR